MTQSPAADALDIHLIAIGGSGMAPLACLLRELGHRVRGSDGPLYPPMSTLLERHGIVPEVGFEPAHLEPPPDLVVVGNAVPRTNPEAEATERLGLPRISMPQALYRFCLAERRPLVVAGTHGKTTTSAMAAWTWTRAGRAPGFLVGGVPVDLPASFRLGSGDRFIVEGDEYNAAYFDRGAKFLHYHPHTLVLTSVEHDHVDLYPTPEALRQAFARLLALLPPDGLLVACGDDDEVRRLAASAPCRVLRYGLGEGNDVGPRGPLDEVAGGGYRCIVGGPDGWQAELALEVPGHHNLRNALAVWAAACADGIDPAAAAEALSTFRGVLRRQQEVGSVAGVTVVDDFAHHPTAVAATLQSLRQRYPGRRLVALFEPRSLTAGRSFFAEGYRHAFAGADRVLLAPIFYRERLADDERLDLPGLVADLATAGILATATESLEELERVAVAAAKAGDVLVCMSSGAFGGLPRRLVEELERSAAPAG